MQISPLIQATPTTLITGFLGAGKTTFINRLLQNKPTQQVWALLINEFGKIGIDNDLINAQDTLAVKQVSGGCICCTSQLPLQIALVRLLGNYHPERLLIEPTGLAHADELMEQLSQSHWQTSLQLRAVICVIHLQQWQQEKYRHHEGYIAHVRAADVIVYHSAQGVAVAQFIAWVQQINPQAQIFGDAELQNAHSLLNLPRQANQPKRIISLTPPKTFSQIEDSPNPALPHRYHDSQAGHHVGGWQLPNAWVFDAYALQKWLLSRPNYLRIKGVVRTSEGWLRLNISAESLEISDSGEHDSTKLEMIFLENAALDDALWQRWDDELMALVL